jgi:hypothetical protein
MIELAEYRYQEKLLPLFKLLLLGSAELYLLAVLVQYPTIWHVNVMIASTFLFILTLIFYVDNGEFKKGLFKEDKETLKDGVKLQGKIVRIISNGRTSAIFPERYAEVKFTKPDGEEFIAYTQRFNFTTIGLVNTECDVYYTPDNRVVIRNFRNSAVKVIIKEMIWMLIYAVITVLVLHYTTLK